MLAGQRRIQSSLHQLLTGAGNGVDTGVQRRGNPTITPCLAGRRGVGLQQDACLQQLTGGGFALLDQHIEPITLLGAKLDDVLLDGRLLRGHDTSPELPERSIQRSAAVSTTEGTSGHRGGYWWLRSDHLCSLQTLHREMVECQI